MKEEIERILAMLEEGKISKEEAIQLIEAVKSGNTPVSEEETVKGGKRYFRIKVMKSGKDAVNIRLPLSIINFGLNIAKKAGKHTIDINGEEVPFDFEEVEKALKDPSFTGKIVDIDKPDEGKHIEIEIV